MSRYSSNFTHAPARPTGRLLCLALATAAWLLAVPCTGLAKKPGGGGGGGNSTPPACLLFDDHPLHNVGSDMGDGASPYCDDKSAKIAITFGNGGGMTLDTNNSNKAGAGRSVYVNFGEEITIVDVEGFDQTFSSTVDLDAMGALHDASVQLGLGQENFDLFNMEVGETRDDVNCQILLQIVFPGESMHTGLRIGLAPTIVGNNRGFPGSDPVSVTFLGDPENDGMAEWIIETSYDNDGDGLVDEDPVDGVDNDGDGFTDEDGEDPGLASVTQAHFAQEPTVGFFDMAFGFRLAVPY